MAATIGLLCAGLGLRRRVLELWLLGWLGNEALRYAEPGQVHHLGIHIAPNSDRGNCARTAGLARCLFHHRHAPVGRSALPAIHRVPSRRAADFDFPAHAAVMLTLVRSGSATLPPVSRTSEKPVASEATGFWTWWRCGDSNSRPLTCEASALPTELHPQGPTRF